jgi:Icc-related predicted phosphoesterase
MVPIVAHNGYWQATLRGETIRMETQEELADVERRIRNRGSYPAIVSPDELTELSKSEDGVDRRFSTEMMRSLDRWLDMADGKLRGGEIGCILNGGNDDIFEIDQLIESSPCVTFAEGKVLDLDGFSLVSMGWTNPTPWDTFREAPEEDLAAKIEAVASQVPDMGRTIFNFHAPPYGTGLDEAPALDSDLRPIHGGAVMKPVGSMAVRDAITRHQPLLSVHGHIHESRGVKKMGRTLALNPGSVYGDGVLQGAVIELDAKKAKVARYLLVNGL